MIICCFGDSLTLGFGDASGRGWPGRICDALLAHVHGVSCYNLGVRADSTPLVRDRWRAEALARLKDSPRALVFCCGAADAAQSVDPGRSRTALREMLEDAARTASTLLLTPPPVAAADVNGRIEALAADFAAAAAELGVPCFDLHAALAGSGTYLASLKRGDGVHPDRTGYDRMAEALLKWPPLREVFSGREPRA